MKPLTYTFSDQISVLNREIERKEEALKAAEGDDKSLIHAELLCMMDSVSVLKALDELAEDRVWRR